MRSKLPTLATLAIVVPAIVLGACNAAVVEPSRLLPSPVASPTAVPIATPVVTPSPTPEPGAGLGCAGPIGGADEIVLVGWDGAAVTVDGVAPDGTRRRLADIRDVPRPERVQVSPCGHLALHADRNLVIVDLHDPARRVTVPEDVPQERDWAFARDGRLTMIDDAWGHVTVLDPGDGSFGRRPWNGDFATHATAAWDGSGWRAESYATVQMALPERVGIVNANGVFRRSAVLVYDAYGFLWWTSADGAQAWTRRNVGLDGHQALDVISPDGTRTTWRDVPHGRMVDTWAWDATGQGLWVLETDGERVNVLHVTGPGRATAIATLPASVPAAVDLAAGTLLLTDSSTLLRLDLSSGEQATLVADLGDTLVAGWAAPPALAPGVEPPTPFGPAEAIPAATAGPVAPDLPLDALALVTCSASGTVVSRPTVRALEDGVHFLVLHPDGSAASVETETSQSIAGYAVVSLPPGAHDIDCGESPSPSPARIDVLDPSGLYRPGELECTDGSGMVSSMDGEPVPGPEAAAWLRTQIGLAPGDVLEPAGYPAESGPRIVLVRGGRVVASFGVLRAGEGLGIASTEHCPGVDVER